VLFVAPKANYDRNDINGLVGSKFYIDEGYKDCLSKRFNEDFLGGIFVSVEK
jgi:hypothetical protein